MCYIIDCYQCTDSCMLQHKYRLPLLLFPQTEYSIYSFSASETTSYTSTHKVSHMHTWDYGAPHSGPLNTTYSHRSVSGQRQAHVLLLQVGVQSRCGCRDNSGTTSRYHRSATARGRGQCCRLALANLCLCGCVGED